MCRQVGCCLDKGEDTVFQYVNLHWLWYSINNYFCYWPIFISKRVCRQIGKIRIGGLWQRRFNQRLSGQRMTRACPIPRLHSTRGTGRTNTDKTVGFLMQRRHCVTSPRCLRAITRTVCPCVSIWLPLFSERIRIFCRPRANESRPFLLPRRPCYEEISQTI